MIKLLPKKSKKVFLLIDTENRAYFSGENFAEGVVVVSNSELTYFADSRYITAVKNAFNGLPVKVLLLEDEYSVKSYLESINAKSVYTDYRKISVSEFERYKKLGVKLKDCAKEIDKLRSKKSASEIKLIKKACEIIDLALEKTLPFIKEGVSELEIKEKLVEHIKFFGGETESFESIVAFGVNSAVPHHQTGNTTLKKESVVLIDTGASYKGYKSDITRTYYFGESPSEKFLENYQAVLNANLLAEEKITCGILAKDGDLIAREYLKEKGLDKYFTHSLGHGVGLEIHEGVRLSPKSTDILKNGTVFTIEPGVYIENQFGIRIEDTVVLSNGKIKTLTKLDKKLKKL